MDGSTSDDEDHGCYVYWETKSILPPCPALPEPAPYKPKSQRSDAPSPSLGASTSGTPRPKRTTSLASLPSPSASTTSTVRPLRQRKKRKALDRRNTVQEPSSQPLDAHTLRMVSQLAMKVSARSAGYASPAMTRGGPLAFSSVGKGKGKEVAKVILKDERPKRQPLRPSPIDSANTPRQSPARSPQSLLTFSATSTKPSLTKPSPLATSCKPLATHPPPSLVRVAAASSTVLDEDEESYFDDDDSFELALSQLDDLTTVATSPPPELAPSQSTVVAAAVAKPPPPRGPAPVPAAVRAASNPPLRSSPRLARQQAAASNRQLSAPPASQPKPSTRQPAPPAFRQPRMSKTTSRTARTTNAARSHNSTSHSLVPSSRLQPPPPKPSLIIRSAGTSKRRVTAETQREMEELAKREVEALTADLLGGEGWSDDEDF
ncbi:hypothetical protein JCM8547_006209 [Rhodosporidiobolus lusitaniae]